MFPEGITEESNSPFNFRNISHYKIYVFITLLRFKGSYKICKLFLAQSNSEELHPM